MAEIYESSLHMGEVLDEWRVDNALPLLMKDCKEKLGNYRAVSLTSVMGKLL